MSPDTVSSLFPDRPIRPLPKRRLRERLSPEVADSIKYPPSTLNSVPLFQYPPYTVKDEPSPPGTGPASPAEQTRRTDPARDYTPCRNGPAARFDDVADSISAITLVPERSPETLSRGSGGPARSEPRQSYPLPSPSVASSVDGYDSFENTNNKKKRKIPSAGDSVLNSAHTLSSDGGLHTVHGNPGSTVDHHGDRTYHAGAGHSGSGSYSINGSGISGSGRGRLGRASAGRSPLRALSDGNNSWSGRVAKGTQPQWASSDFEGPGPGIISNAIANAGKHPMQGQENVSLLQQHSSASKTTPASTQFTFTCDSQVPGTKWPGHDIKGGVGSSSLMAQNDAISQDQPGKAPTRESRRKTRRSLQRELDNAARHRKKLQEVKNRQNPPKGKDLWMCEFCEYEAIFGKPPKALIRQYELKDRRVRQEEADRKRLLEKAKAKGRKAKKNGKSAGNRVSASVVDPSHDDQTDDNSSMRPGHGSTQSEGDEDDDHSLGFEGGPLSPSPGSRSGTMIDPGGGIYRRPPPSLRDDE